MITPEEGYIYYKELLHYVAKRLVRKTNFIEKKSYQEVNTLLEKGEIDVAFVCGGPYVEGHRKFGLELLVAPQVNGKTVYYSYIIVRKDSEINKFEDLKGRIFAFVDPLSNSGRLAPNFHIIEMGENPEKFFKECMYSYGHDKSIKAVALGIVDAAAVDSLIWHYLEKRGSKYARNTKIIKVLGPYGIPPVVVRPGLDRELKKKIKSMLLSMHKDKIGEPILKGMDIDRFVTISNLAYSSIRKIKKRVKL
jgi:phosphonate transport system substrate-binding protein